MVWPKDQEPHNAAMFPVVFFATLNLLAAAPALSQGGAKIEEASELRFDQPASFTIPEKGASAWFRLKIEAPGYVRLLLDKKPEKLDTCYDTWSFDAFEGKKRLAAPRGANLPARVEPGELWLRVHDEWDDEFTKKVFGFRMSFRAESDPSEPNDTPETARPIQIGKNFELEIAQKGDQDWLVVDVEKRGLLLLELSPQAAPADLELRFSVYRLDETGKAIELRQIRPCTDRHAYSISEPGRYLLQVLDEWNDEWSFTKAVFRTRLLPQDNVNERNDSPETATGLGLPFRQELRDLPDRRSRLLRADAARGGVPGTPRGTGRSAQSHRLVRPAPGEEQGRQVGGTRPHESAPSPLHAQGKVPLRAPRHRRVERRGELRRAHVIGNVTSDSGAEIRIEAPKSETAPPVAVPELIG